MNSGELSQGGKQGHVDRIGPVRFLCASLRPHRLLVAVASALMLLSAVVILGIGMGASRAIDSGYLLGPSGASSGTAAVLVIAAAVMAAVMFGRDYAIAHLSERVVFDLRRRLFGTLLTLPPAFFERTQAGDLIMRLTVDVTRVQEFVSVNLFKAIRSLITFCAALVIVLVLDATLAALIVGLAIAVVAPAAIIGSRGKRLSIDAQESFAELVSFGEQSIAMMKTIQMFVFERVQSARFAQLLAKGRTSSIRRKRQKCLTMALGLMLAILAVAAAGWFGLHQIASGQQTVGALTSFLIFMGLLVIAGGTLLDAWSDFQPAAAAVVRIQDLLAQESTGTRPADVVRLLPAPRGTVTFKDVTFRYPSRPNHAVLDKVCFRIEAGEAVAMIGESGSGKSTILDLLCRFWDPSQGMITIDGIDLAWADRSELRSLIGYVPQDPVILGANVSENIRLGRPDATEQEIRAAADLAFATPFVDLLPQGFATMLGEKGACLSGGQRQRLALARVILRNPRILLLDEITSALDPGAANVVGQAISAFARSRTTIAVTHSPAMARHFDRVILLRDGRVAADGSHGKLLCECPFYQHFAGSLPISSAA